MLYEIAGVQVGVAREAFKLAAAKLPVRTVFIERQAM
jgi:large subunit ribosomal protein L16